VLCAPTLIPRVADRRQEWVSSGYDLAASGLAESFTQPILGRKFYTARGPGHREMKEPIVNSSDDDADDLRMPSTRTRRASSISFESEEMPVAPSRMSEPPSAMFGARNAAANPATNDPTQPLLDLAELNRRPFSAS
jgi:hypothetical protein